MAHFNYHGELWEQYCIIANSVADINLKPKFEVLIQYPDNLGKEPEKQQITLISSKEIMLTKTFDDGDKEIYYEIDKKDNFVEIPGVRLDCYGYDLETEEGKYFKVTSDLFIKGPELVLAPDCIVYVW